MTTGPPILYEVRDAVAEITLNRPDKLNAFDRATIQALREAAERAAGDDAVRAVLLTGSGRAFTSGGDVAEMLAHADKDEGRAYVLSLTEHHHPLVELLVTMPKPVVVAVNGVAAGGGFGLALAGDLRLGSEHARFKPAYYGIGVVPDGGITWLLPRLVGVSRAQDVLFHDRVIRAHEALEMGLLHRVVRDEDLLPIARQEAERLARAPAFAVAATKRLLNGCYANTLQGQLHEERRLNGRSADTADFAEGVRAFKEKRAPRFG